jgi:two-component system NtrC family sensor kinase
MQSILRRLGGWRLQYIMVIGFVLITAITVAVGSWVIYTLVNNYLQQAEEERVSRDMDLATAFYDLKLNDLRSTAERLSTTTALQEKLAAAADGDAAARTAIDAEIDDELSVLPPTTQRFVVTLGADGRAVVGRVCCKDGRQRLAVPNSDWSVLPVVANTLSRNSVFWGTEVMPAEVLVWAGLDEQARIPLVDTPMAAPEPFDPREGTAGLAILAASPVRDKDNKVVGAVLVGHLFNNDFTLVDRIKEVAGVDTATIFLGDQRVSTNVRAATGGRAVGTRVSQEVFNTVLVQGEEFTGPAYVVDQWYISRYEPIRDHLGDVVGILYVGARQASFQQLVLSFRDRVLLIAAGTLLAAALIAIPVAWLVTRPLSTLAAATRRVAQGDWSVRVATQGPRETGILAESFNTMVETLKDTRDQLVQKEKLASVGQLAAGVAHEINNPLGSVLLYADILRKETPEDNVQQREDLEMIMSEATRCKTIVTDLLNFSRQNEVLAQDTDLNDLLHELAQEVSRKELYSRISLIEELAPDLPSIQADPLQLRQVFLNLMNNAAEAMPEGGRLTVRTRRGPMSGHVTAEVEDTGTGIAPENMKKMFTPFFTTKPIGKGTGLGLAIIYGIVKMHQGQISVQSEVGKGTVFTVALREHLPSLPKKGQTVLG